MSTETTPEAIAAALGVALAPAATPEQRAAGAALARAIVAQLEPSAPPPNAPAAAIPVASPLPQPPQPPQPPNLAGMLHDVLAQLNARSPEQRAQLRKLGPDLLLDLAITKLRAAVPDGATAPAPVGAFNVRLVGVPGRS